MTETIPVTFQGQEFALPRCKATNDLMIMPGMDLTKNQLWVLADAMRKDKDAAVAAFGEEIRQRFTLPDDPRVFSGLDFSGQDAARALGGSLSDAKD